MAKRNQVTTELRISADAQLKNSRNFLTQLDKIIDKFDFGNKINNQLLDAKNQLKNYNKVLEKIHSKSIISDDELKDLVKAGKEIANIVTKTEKLYSNMSSSELQKFSKEYIKQVKAQEAAIAKIKNEYTNKTGKNFDKELANYDKVKAKIKELQKERDTLMKSGTTSIATKEVEQLNTKLEEQKKKLAEIKKLQQQSSSAYISTLENESKKRGYNNYNELKNTKVLSETQIRKQLGNAEYKQQANLISTINRQVKELENSKKDANQLDKEAIKIAKQYQIQNVSNLQTLKEQLKIKRDILNKYKTDKSALANEKLVTAELEKRRRTLADKNAVDNAGRQEELAVIQKGGYNSKASLTATGSAVNKSITNLTGQLTESGIETITNNAANVVAQKLEKINGELTRLIDDTNSIDETNKKLATQSERVADEHDIIAGAKTQIDATNADGKTTRNQIVATEKNLSDDLIKREALEARTPVKEVVQHANELMIKPSIDNLPTTQMTLIDIQDLDKATQIIDEVARAGSNLERYYDYLSSDMTSEEYEIITGNVIQELQLLEKSLSQVNQIYGKVATRQKDKNKNEIENLIKHNSKGQAIKDINGNFIPKKGKEFLLQEKLQERQQINETLAGLADGESKFHEIYDTSFKKVSRAHQVLQQNVNTTSNAKKATIDHSNAVKEASDNLEKAADRSKFLGSTLDDFKNKVQYFLSLNYALDFVTRTARQATTFVRDLDKDMVQIGLVLEQTSDKVWKNFDTYSNMANRLSTTTSDVTAAMKLFYQQGLNTSEVNKMVEASAIAAALGESTMAEASETLTSIINSYNLSANEALSVTDKISQVAIVSAADFGELSTAIEKVASQAATVGLDLDHMMGYLGKMIETTREAPTNLGTALKTILANFAQFKEDPTAALEDGADINKAQKALQSVGIQLLDTNGEMRDLGVVIDELGREWNGLTRNQKSYLATTIAGTRQQSRFYALMNDYERTMELVAEANDSAGKSTQQFVLYQDSLTGATARLKNQTEIFYGKLMEGDGLLKNLANAGTGLLKIINKLGPKTTVLASLFGLKFARDGINALDLYKQKLQETLRTAMSTSGLIERAQGSASVNTVINQQQFGLKGTNWIGKTVANRVAKSNGLQAEVTNMQKLLEVQKLLKDETIIYDDVLKQQIASLNINTLTTDTLTKSTREEALAEVTATAATTADSIAKKSATVSTWGLVAANAALTMGVALIGAAIGLVVDAFTKWINRENEATQAAQERLSNQQEEVKTLQNLSNTYKKLNAEVNLTDEEHEELASTIKELGELYPELVAQYNAEGEAIALVNEELAKKLQLEKQSEKEAARSSIKATLGNTDKQLDAYGYHSGFTDIDTAAILKDAGVTLKDGEVYHDFVSHTDIENAIGENAKAAFEEQQQQIENFVQQGKQFDLSWGNNASNSIAGTDLIDVLQNYAANNISTETALSMINAFEKDAKSKAKDNTDIDALERYYNEIRTFLQQSNEEIANANKRDITVLASDYSNAAVNASGLTDQKAGYAKTAINNILGSKSETMNDKDFMKYVYEDEQFQADVENVITEIRKMSSAQLQYYEDFIEDYASGNQSIADLQDSYNKIKNKIPATLQTIIETNLDSYDDYLDTFGEKVTADEEILNSFKTLKKTMGQKMLDGYDNIMEETLKDDKTGQAEFKEKYIELMKNEAFLNDFNNLDTSDLAEVQNFKEKYRTTLGNYGLEFFNSILTAPDYDAEKISEGLNNALNAMQGTGVTTSGANMEDIATGNSQEGAFNILSSEDETRAQNLLLIGDKLVVSAEEISDSYRDAYKNISNYTTQVISQAEEKIDDNINTIRNTLNNENWNIGDSIDFSSLNEAEKETVQNAQKAINNLNKQKKVAEELQERYKLLNIEQKANVDYGNFRNGVIAANEMVSSLSNLADIYDVVTTKEYTQLDLINWIANDTTGQLLAALEVQNGQLMLNANSMEILAESHKQEAISAIDAEIAKTEAQIAYVEAHGATSQQILDNIGAIDEGESGLSSNTATYMSSMMQNWTDWAKNVSTNGFTIGNIINGLILAYNQLHKAEDEGTGSTNTITGGGTGNTSTSDNSGNTSEINDLVTLETLQDKLAKLKALREGLNKMSGKDLLGGINEMGSYGGGDGGSDDEFEPIIEKLEKFYNYLRQLEELEAEINRIREKRNLIDASKNYYVQDLREENELLREQQSIYNDYIRDQGFYLAELRSQIQSEFGDWAYFNKDGVIQVRQTEFTANSEEEEEHLNNFLELVDLYQNEYNTREENINKLYEIENTQLENIKTLYEKILTRVQDINDELNRQVDLLDHDLTMSFENIAKYDIMDDKAIVAVEGIKTAQAYLNDFEEQVKSLNQEVKNGPFSELLLWDEALQIWRTNEEALQDESIIAKYEAMGYAWQDIDTYIRSVATKSQSIRDAWKETEDSANAFAEQLKQLIDDRISAIQDFYGASTEELNKIFDSFEEKMTDIDNQNNLFGVAAASLEEKYLTLVTAVAVLKQTIGQLNNNRQSILDKMQEEYPEYITMINGVAIANKQAIEESNKLSEEQKAELLQLYGILEASEEQIGEMEDKLVDYFNTMLEMEQAKRDAIIDLKQSVHDELIARDQEEIDNLRSKYDKMSQLDSEYYSELSQRVNDSRNLRENRQQASDIAQMQARLAILKADNSGTYNAELIDLQKQINTALQTQADNEINMELERIQREQQQREEDRQLTISAMENVLTFKDDNNWYWQEAQRIWDEGPESVTGFLRSSREYMNISDEQRAAEFLNLTNNMNTAFSTLQTEAGLSDRISDGVVIGKSDEEQLKLDNVNNNLSFIQQQLGQSGLAGKIDWTNSQNMLKLDSVIAGSQKDAKFITDKMQTLYTEKIGPGTDSVKGAITSYLGENSSIWKKLNESDIALDQTQANMNTGFSNSVKAASDAANTIVKCINDAKEEYLETDNRLYKWLNDKYAKDNADKTTVTTGSASTKAPTTSGNGNSSSSAGGKGTGSSAASQPSLAIGSTVSVKPGTRWYYDSYGTNPSGVARGGKITYTNLKGSHPYNIEGLGWIKKTDIVGYSKGGYVDYTGVANVHGTQREPEAFLNAKQTRLFEMLRDGLVRTTSKTYEKPTNTETNKQEYNIDNLSIEVKELADVDSIEKVTKRVKEEIYKDSIGHNNMAVRRR